MRSVRHGLKKCEKTLCDAKKFTIKANMDCYHLPFPVMKGYFKQITPPKATSDLENQEHSLNKLTEFKKNGCRISPSHTSAWQTQPQLNHKDSLVLQASRQL